MSFDGILAGLGAPRAEISTKTPEQIRTEAGDVPIYLSQNKDFNELKNSAASAFDISNPNAVHTDDYRSFRTPLPNGDSIDIKIDSGDSNRGYNNMFDVFSSSFSRLVNDNEIDTFSYHKGSEVLKAAYAGNFENYYHGKDPISALKDFVVDLDMDGNPERQYSYNFQQKLDDASYDVDDDGNFDYHVEYHNYDKVLEEFDLDSDGVFDCKYEYGDNEYTKTYSSGKTKETYDKETNELLSVSKESDDGIVNSYYADGRIDYSEIDENKDGKVDFVRTYDEDGTYKEKDKRGFLQRIFG